MDLNVFQSHGNVNWDDRIYPGMPGLPGGAPGEMFYKGMSTSTFGFAAQYTSRWWDRDFGDGGLYTFTMMHTTGFDVGNYSIRIDGLEIGKVDGYSLADVAFVMTTVALRVPISPGPHRISIEINDANPATTGLKYYPVVHGFYIQKVGPYKPKQGGSPMGHRGPTLFGRTVDICPFFATGNTNWSTWQIANLMWFGYELYSTGAQNAARWWDIALEAGQWDLEIRCATFSAAGIISIQIDGVTVGTIDTYSASTVYGVKKITRITVPTSGVHQLKFLMATKNGSASAYYGDISALQLRQAPVSHLPTAFWPAYRWIPAFHSTGQLGWPDSGNTIANIPYGGYSNSDGNQNSARWWDLNLMAGTYAFDMWYSKAGNRGIFSVQIDGKEVGTIDGYNSTFVANITTTISNIVIPFNGIHRISLVMASKNASSTLYYASVTMFALRRTGS
jgi:hypothetical protein